VSRGKEEKGWMRTGLLGAKSDRQGQGGIDRDGTGQDT
jgi:hypothetical protein